MFKTICFHYPSLPDPRSLTIEEIYFFYSGLKQHLIELTTPRK